MIISKFFTLFWNRENPDQLASMEVIKPADLDSHFLIHIMHAYLGLDARKPVFMVCEQHRSRPACASAQSDQRLCCSLFGKKHMLTCYRWNFIFLASLCSWGDWFETPIVGNPKTGFKATRPIYNQTRRQEWWEIWEAHIFIHSYPGLCATY